MTALELAKLMHDAHLKLHLDSVLDSEFGFLPMEWDKTHMKYQGTLVRIAEDLLKHITVTEKGPSNE